MIATMNRVNFVKLKRRKTFKSIFFFLFLEVSSYTLQFCKKIENIYENCEIFYLFQMWKTTFLVN